MSAFTAPLDTRSYIGPGDLQALINPLVWASEHGDMTLTVTVPAGYIFDGASIPWYLRMILSPSTSGVKRGAAIHDRMYDIHAYDQRSATRVEADWEFREALKVDHLVNWRCQLAYMAVRCFGGRAWNNKQYGRIDHKLVASRNTIEYALNHLKECETS